MAWYQLVYHPTIRHDLAPLELAMAQRLLDKTKWIASNVGHLRHLPLGHDLPTLFKYSVEDWRIVYAIDHTDHVVEIHALVHHHTFSR